MSPKDLRFMEGISIPYVSFQNLIRTLSIVIIIIEIAKVMGMVVVAQTTQILVRIMTIVIIINI